MFSLIISVMSLGLAVALLVVMNFSGGSAGTKGAAHANAVALINQGNQILGFSAMYEQDPAYKSLTGINDLISAGYMTRIPTATINGVTGTWSLPQAGVAAFLFSQPVTTDTCEAINKQTRGDAGIYSKINLRQPVQCFGSSAYSVLTGTPKSLAAYAKAVGLDTVDGVPAASDSGWTVAPDTVVPSPSAQTGYSCSVYAGNNAIPTNGYGATDPSAGYTVYVALWGPDAVTKFANPSISYGGVAQVNPSIQSTPDTSLVGGIQLQVTGYQLAHAAGSNVPLTFSGTGGAAVSCSFNSVPYDSISAQDANSVSSVAASNNTGIVATAPNVVSLVAYEGEFHLGPHGEKPIVSLGLYGTVIVPDSDVTLVDATHLTFTAPSETTLKKAGVTLSGLGNADFSGNVTVFAAVNDYLAQNSAGFMLRYTGATPPAPAFVTELALTANPEDSKTFFATMTAKTPGALSQLWGTAPIANGSMSIGLDYLYNSDSAEAWPKSGDVAAIKMRYYIPSYDVFLPAPGRAQILRFKQQTPDGYWNSVFTAMLASDGVDTSNTWCIRWAQDPRNPSGWVGSSTIGHCS